MQIFNTDGNESYERIEKKKVDNFKDFLANREKNRAQLQKRIQSVLKDYSGEMAAIVLIHEDENGKPESSTELVVGVAGQESIAKLAQCLHTLSHEVKDKLEEHGEYPNEKSAEDMVKEFFKDIAKEMRKRNK